MWSKLGWFLRRRTRDAELDQEMHAHIEAEIEEQVEAGVPPEQARNDALRAFGNQTLAVEEIRSMWRFTTLETFAKDIHYGVRLLRRSPLFTVFTIASLALGIGAASAIFSLFDAIVLRELPVREPSRLVGIRIGKNFSLPHPHIARIREFNTTLEGIFATGYLGRASVVFQGHSDLAFGTYVSGEYHGVLGVAPALGRLFAPDDDHKDSSSAVISYGYWQRRFGGRPEALGASIEVNRVPFTIVGVEPHGFFGMEVGQSYDFALPLRAMERLSTSRPGWDEPFRTWLYSMARLKPGMKIERAQQELNMIARRVYADAVPFATPHGKSFAERMAREATLYLDPGATGAISGIRDRYQRSLRLLLWMLGAVLVLASLNVATLLLSRSEARSRELSTRLALGAGPWRVMRQLLTESMLLAGCGGALGLALAWWGSAALLRLAAPGFERMAIDVTPDFRVAGFTIAVSTIACLLFGLIPALRATSHQEHATSRQIGAGRRGRRLDGALVASQVALTLVLLVCAGLFLRSLQTLWTQETGYQRANVLLFTVDAGLAGKKGPDSMATYKRVLEELRAMAGSRSASASVVRPVTDGFYFVDVITSIGQQKRPDDQMIRVAYNVISPLYFDTMGIPLLAGRDFDSRDEGEAPGTIIISELIARRYFNGRNPVGERVTLHNTEPFEIVGVAKDTRYGNVKDAPREVVYLPMFHGKGPGTASYEVRYAGSAAEIEGRVRALVAKVNPALPIFRMKTLDVQTEESLAGERMMALLASYFGGFALLLASIGLYGLVSYAVTRRTPEIGLRMALGARPSEVQRMVLSESFRIVLCGVAVGLAASFGAVRLVRTQLYGIEAYDAVSMTSATLLLVAIAFCSSALPALRAARVDPMRALRCE
jgi:predicted permease